MNAGDHEFALAAEPFDDVDATLINSIRGVYAAGDPVPKGLAERLQFGITLHALQAEVTALTERVLSPLAVP